MGTSLVIGLVVARVIHLREKRQKEKKSYWPTFTNAFQKRSSKERVTEVHQAGLGKALLKLLRFAQQSRQYQPQAGIYQQST
ncbi:MAG: hypothetical protein A3D24_02710 [Candidatus Blackburnbacteria bacterium RIFCSPHIGHO2_02_FULL_39_13]|uniref:Uncharacterized protein n=1 Tax=Candidatus Blackburnbacteria bacterium RIFCSPLOWO2_01_FULL_40_20 TaxID=1797519 RepID=A0A1G1VBJ0_9BACT|nr:MAG: hypothetical protein A2694_01615 [Candidatus Blackburnbacteria bacterium RIFCSPHIGHO2_01_FULL_40_17]OGY07736.1 MAG: hypothetical protein A3D24_02710 [Candidatus Blackburnbacteria bacterium RIFCSPHIGHO2_02_FULL_39_13]OGY12795.1 MAG: hypothetical protein A3A77_02875 [Candidatus Blackburnbacteria bacterium RIFCSPLOWO2_01_FULL_40_20]